jgi:hypothetical protein
MSGFNFTNNVTGGNAQILQGQNVTGTMNVSDGDLDLNKLFELLIADVPEEIKEPLEKIKTEAIKETPELKNVQAEFDKVKPLGEKIGKVLGKLGWATAKGLLTSNPIGAVVLSISEAFAQE